MEGPSRRGAAETLQGAEGGQPFSTALQPALAVHDYIAPAIRDWRQSCRADDPDCDPHWRGPLRGVVGNRFGRSAVDHPRGAYESRARPPSAALGARTGNPNGIAAGRGESVPRLGAARDFKG